ncbi:hypothetical protein [Allostreptomyces psammosilenae]
MARTLALVLPVVMVMTGTLAVTQVRWAGGADSQLLGPTGSSDAAEEPPQQQLRRHLLAELWENDPGVALDGLAQAMRERPSLTQYCTGIAKELGRAAVEKYKGNLEKARAFARPVCDESFASGVSTAR